MWFDPHFTHHTKNYFYFCTTCDRIVNEGAQMSNFKEMPASQGWPTIVRNLKNKTYCGLKVRFLGKQTDAYFMSRRLRNDYGMEVVAILSDDRHVITLIESDRLTNHSIFEALRSLEELEQ